MQELKNNYLFKTTRLQKVIDGYFFDLVVPQSCNIDFDLILYIEDHKKATQNKR